MMLIKELYELQYITNSIFINSSDYNVKKGSVE